MYFSLLPCSDHVAAHGLISLSVEILNELLLIGLRVLIGIAWMVLTGLTTRYLAIGPRSGKWKWSRMALRFFVLLNMPSLTSLLLVFHNIILTSLLKHFVAKLQMPIKNASREFLRARLALLHPTRARSGHMLEQCVLAVEVFKALRALPTPSVIIVTIIRTLRSSLLLHDDFVEYRCIETLSVCLYVDEALELERAVLFALIIIVIVLVWRVVGANSVVPLLLQDIVHGLLRLLEPTLKRQLLKLVSCIHLDKL